MAVGAAIPALRMVSSCSRDMGSPVKLRILVRDIMTSRAEGTHSCDLQPVSITDASTARIKQSFFIIAYFA